MQSLTEEPLSRPSEAMAADIWQQIEQDQPPLPPLPPPPPPPPPQQQQQPPGVDIDEVDDAATVLCGGAEDDTNSEANIHSVGILNPRPMAEAPPRTKAEPEAPAAAAKKAPRFRVVRRSKRELAKPSHAN